MTIIATSLHTLAEASCPNLSESSRLAWIGGFVEGARVERREVGDMVADHGSHSYQEGKRLGAAALDRAKLALQRISRTSTDEHAVDTALAALTEIVAMEREAR